MPFRSRKTQELDIEQVERIPGESPEEYEEELTEEYEEESPEEYAEEPTEEYGEEPAEDLYYDEPAADGLYEEEDDSLSSLDIDFEDEPAETDRLSPVETGAWDYIHGEPNEDYLTDTGNFRFDLDGPAGGVFLPEEKPEGEVPRKEHVRKKHKKHHYLLKFFSACVAIALLYAFMMSSYFDVEKIKVEGVVNFSDEQIVEMSGLKTGKNIFKIKAGKAEDRIETDPHIAKATIKRDLPKTLVITVEERLPAAQVPYDEQYVVIDGNGYILSVGDKADGAAVIKGLTLKGEHITAGTDMKVKEAAALDEALALLHAAAVEGFTFRTMDMSEDTVRLYLTKNLLIKGKPAMIKRHIENGDITLILKDLKDKKIKKGTIKATTEESFTFSPDKE